jgi:hypothetical protein
MWVAVVHNTFSSLLFCEMPKARSITSPIMQACVRNYLADWTSFHVIYIEKDIRVFDASSMP